MADIAKRINETRRKINAATMVLKGHLAVDRDADAKAVRQQIKDLEEDLILLEAKLPARQAFEQQNKQRAAVEQKNAAIAAAAPDVHGDAFRKVQEIIRSQLAPAVTEAFANLTATQNGLSTTTINASPHRDRAFDVINDPFDRDYVLLGALVGVGILSTRCLAVDFVGTKTADIDLGSMAESAVRKWIALSSMHPTHHVSEVANSAA